MLLFGNRSARPHAVPTSAAPAAPVPQGELDFLADGMLQQQQPGGQQQQQPGVDGFGEQPAFGPGPDNNMTGMPPPGGSWVSLTAAVT
jgi:hypothetical protein